MMDAHLTDNKQQVEVDKVAVLHVLLDRPNQRNGREHYLHDLADDLQHQRLCHLISRSHM
jgi:hypothetical protein